MHPNAKKINAPESKTAERIQVQNSETHLKAKQLDARRRNLHRKIQDIVPRHSVRFAAVVGRHIVFRPVAVVILSTGRFPST